MTVLATPDTIPMTVTCDVRRVLLAADGARAGGLRALFDQPELRRWIPLEADNSERLRFVLQHERVDVLLLDDGPWDDEATAAPVVRLLPPSTDRLTAALEGGAATWLPHDLSVLSARLLAAALNRADLRRDEDLRCRRTGEALGDCHRRVGRLLGMLWDNTPVDGHTRWYSQRHMMDRLHEEAARVARHGDQFSVVIGEVRPRSEAVASPDWLGDHLHRLKRRCDVLGHYGPNGFLMLMPHTSEAGATAFCQRLRYSLDQAPPRPSAQAAPLFGVAACADGRIAPKAMLRRAEERLEEARAATTVGLVS